MKNIFLKLSFVLALFSSLVFTSCEDFLTEDNKTGFTADLIYSDPKNLQGYLNSTYPYLRLLYGKEGGIGLTEAGTDIWMAGNGNQQQNISYYSGLTADKSNENNLYEYIEIFNFTLNYCNQIIELTINSTAPDDGKKENLSTSLFLRAFWLYHSVETFGGLQCKTNTEFDIVPHRDSPSVYYAQIIADLDNSILNFGDQNIKSEYGNVTKWAAKAFKARVCLTIASTNKYLNPLDNVNSDTYYAMAKSLADEVIQSGTFSLYNNYADTWDIKNADGSVNTECIWYTDYQDNTSFNSVPLSLTKDEKGDYISYTGHLVRKEDGTQAGNNLMVMFNPTWYTGTTGNGLKYISNSGGIPDLKQPEKHSYALSRKEVKDNVNYRIGYARFCPTQYLLGLYDAENDQRYRGTWTTAYISNNATSADSTMKYFPLMKDTAILMLREDATAAQLAWANKRYAIIDKKIMFKPDGTPTTDGKGMYFAINKFNDTDKLLPDNNWSKRDHFILRLAEMYLISAEAAMETGDAAGAKSRINQLRAKRAVSGKTYALNASEEAQIDARDVNVMLDERARELCGEFIRWYDLKRTNTLVKRVTAYNKQAAVGIKPFHINRPIPNTVMNTITNITAPNTQVDGGKMKVISQ